MVKSSSSLPLAANHARFSELVEQTLAYARQIGASDAAAEVSESLGLSVSVRKNDIETVEQTRDRSLDLTVYAGQSRGSASTSDFSESADFQHCAHCAASALSMSSSSSRPR